MTYTVLKQSGTYAETLEWLGFSYFLEKLYRNLHGSAARITLNSGPDRYTVTVDQDITQDNLVGLRHYWILPFIRSKTDVKVPDDVPNEELRDYPNQKRIRDEQRVQRETIQKDKSLSVKEKALELKELGEYQKSELSERLDLDFDVYREMVRNPYPAYLKLFENFRKNDKHLPRLIWEILSYYEIPGSITKSQVKGVPKDINFQQLYSPDYNSRGSNQEKANGHGQSKKQSFWIPETMKILGALRTMFCQYIKVGTGLDLKLNVPEFNNIDLDQVSTLLSRFKQSIRANSAVKVDILNVLSFSKLFIENSPEYKSNTGWRRTKISNSIRGFHSVIQKDLGQNRAVVNMSFIGVPTFVSYQNLEEAQRWITILKEQYAIVLNIDKRNERQGEVMDGLKAYRSFLSGSDLYSFFQFSTFYATYLTRELAAEHYYVKPFKTEHLNQFFNSMSTDKLKLWGIISNPGFLSIARAIRKSTVSLQYTPKRERKFNIRYGLAQELQVKSKSTDDLATFVGDFITTYNAETARYEELRRNSNSEGTKAARAVVKDAELSAFYQLLDNYPSRLIGALLGSYGFALTIKDQPATPADGQLDNIDADEVADEETDIDF